jgi:hypothetical protein
MLRIPLTRSLRFMTFQLKGLETGAALSSSSSRIDPALLFWRFLPRMEMPIGETKQASDFGAL